jgi:hypothetical protein
MTRRTHRQLALASLVLPLAVAACGKKEEPPPPPAQTRSIVPPTTMLAPPTTLPAPTAVPTPVPVWRTLRWGMKKNEVQAALKGEVQRLPKPAPFAQPQPGSRLPAGSSDLEIPAYEADGARFHVLFGFEAGALNRVHLSAIKPGAATCRDLETALTAKHAAPTERATTGTTLKGEEIVWKRPDQTVVLGCAGVARLGFVTVTLDYLAPDVAAAKD